MDGKEIIPYIDPIFRFCCSRLNSRYDAEDLAAEILCHVLEGLEKYEIHSLESWIWRIAHNRYARFVDARKRNAALLSDKELCEIAYELENDYCRIDERSVEEEFEPVFLCLHRLSSEYRTIFVDYYIGEMSVKQLSLKHGLPETTIKWRLNVGRGKIRKWIGEEQMEKVYRRINWNTEGCNGNVDADRYLHAQIARAICQAAYDKPLTVEEISACTGIPTLYIEDEIPGLEYGEALQKTGNKYATDFIVLRLADRIRLEEILVPAINEAADCLEEALWGRAADLEKAGFYGCEAGMEKLGYIFVPYFLRRRIKDLKDSRLNLPDGDFPPRKDGGYGWFHIEETQDGKECITDYNAGCNAFPGDKGNVYYYWIAKYFDQSIYHNGGLVWMCRHGLLQNSQEGVIPENGLTEDDILRLLEANLIRKSAEGYRLNFACFTHREFQEVCRLFPLENGRLDDLLCDRILAVRKEFEKFVPKRLQRQINQWVTCFSTEIVSRVAEELIRRGRLERPDPEKPFVRGVFYVEGAYIEP